MSSEASFFQPSKLTYKEKHSLPDRLVIGPWQRLETVVWGVGKKPELIKGEEKTFKVRRISQTKAEGTVVDVSRGEILCGSDLIKDRKYSKVDETDIYPASVIAHEAKHIDLYERRLPFKGEGAEKICVKFQVFALTEMGASEETIQKTDWARLALEAPWHRKKPGVRWFEQ